MKKLLPMCLVSLVLSGCARTYSGISQEEETMYRQTAAYGKQVAKERGHELLIVGNATDDEDIIYCLTFRSTGLMTLEEAKKMAPGQIQSFIHMLKTCPEVAKFLEYRRTNFPFKPTTFQLRHVAWRLVFWNKAIERPKPPYLAEILYKNDTIYYYETNPATQGLQLVYTQNFKGDE